MSEVTFAHLGLCDPILKVLKEEGYNIPTPIQAQGIPPVLDNKDVMGCAQTGTGKTAAFALPILHRFAMSAAANPGQASSANRKIRALILSPTRELANQIDESFRTYGRHLHLRSTVVFGGVSQMHQERALRKGVDFLVATPGRLLDLAEQRIVDLSHVEVLVLDEADNMLDMGFIHDIRRIITRLPAKRQNLLFSATMPREIRELADTILVNPVTVSVTPVSSAVETVEQTVYMVERKNKPALLMHYLENNGITRVLVFTRTKHGADKVVKHLERCGVFSVAIHGNKNQNARNRAIQAFKSQRPPVLVATDIAARGLDIDAVSHVVNYDIPNVPETYVHRIGRTGRAGATGDAVSFCDHEERPWLRSVERLIKKAIPVRTDHPSYPGGNNVPAGRASASGESRDGYRNDDRGDRNNDRNNDRADRNGNQNRGNERWGTFDEPKPRFPRHAAKPAHPMAAPANISPAMSEDEHDLSEDFSDDMLDESSQPARPQPAFNRGPARNQHSTGGSFMPSKGFTPAKKKEHRKGKSQIHRTGTAPAVEVIHTAPVTAPVAEAKPVAQHSTTEKIHATKHAVAPKHVAAKPTAAPRAAAPRADDRKPFVKKPFGDRRPSGDRPFNRSSSRDDRGSSAPRGGNSRDDRGPRRDDRRDDRPVGPFAKRTTTGAPRPHANGPKKDFASPGTGVKSFGNNRRGG